jgi:hypothetical protein
MAKSQPMQYGVIREDVSSVGFSVLPVMGLKEDGKVIIFPPQNVLNDNVIAFFDSKLEADLWVANKKLETVEKQLADEKAAHSLTKVRTKMLMSLIDTFRGDSL